jgi:hypothetical protein
VTRSRSRAERERTAYAAYHRAFTELINSWNYQPPSERTTRRQRREGQRRRREDEQRLKEFLLEPEPSGSDSA